MYLLLQIPMCSMFGLSLYFHRFFRMRIFSDYLYLKFIRPVLSNVVKSKDKSAAPIDVESDTSVVQSRHKKLINYHQYLLHILTSFTGPRRKAKNVGGSLLLLMSLSRP
jgi:hypothetical protein